MLLLTATNINMPEQFRPRESQDSKKSEAEKFSAKPENPKDIKLREYMDRANVLLLQWTRKEGMPDDYAPTVVWGSDSDVEEFDSGRRTFEQGRFPKVDLIVRQSHRGILFRNRDDASLGYPSVQNLRITFEGHLPEMKMIFRDNERNALIVKKAEEAAKKAGLKGKLHVHSYFSERYGDTKVIQYQNPKDVEQDQRRGDFLRAIPIVWNEDLSPNDQMKDLDAQIQRNVAEAMNIENGEMTPGIDRDKGKAEKGSKAPTEEEKLRDENAALKREIERLRQEQKNK